MFQTKKEKILPPKPEPIDIFKKLVAKQTDIVISNANILEVFTALNDNSKLWAIKHIKTHTNLGLRYAKMVIDQFCDVVDISTDLKFSNKQKLEFQIEEAEVKLAALKEELLKH